jgi:hypothetical protein
MEQESLSAPQSLLEQSSGARTLIQPTLVQQHRQGTLQTVALACAAFRISLAMVPLPRASPLALGCTITWMWRPSFGSGAACMAREAALTRAQVACLWLSWRSKQKDGQAKWKGPRCAVCQDLAG